MLLKLYIAEKPSLGRAIAAALPKPHKNQSGYIELGNGDVVSWCIGHILEQADPEVYNIDFKKWRMDHLPIIPQQWQLTPKAQTRAQLTVLRKLVKNATEIIHAGDPDRVTINHHKFDTIFLLYNSIYKIILSLHKLDTGTKLNTLTKSTSIIDKYMQKKSSFLTMFDNHYLLFKQA